MEEEMKDKEAEETKSDEADKGEPVKSDDDEDEEAFAKAIKRINEEGKIMKWFKYKVLTYDDHEIFENSLHPLGREGWELTHTFFSSLNARPDKQILFAIFKQEYEPEKD